MFSGGKENARADSPLKGKIALDIMIMASTEFAEVYEPLQAYVRRRVGPGRRDRNAENPQNDHADRKRQNACSTASKAPGGRGALPHVSTTVTSVTRRPAATCDATSAGSAALRASIAGPYSGWLESGSARMDVMKRDAWGREERSAARRAV